MPSKLPLVYFESQTKVLGIGIQQNEEEKSISEEKKSIFLLTSSFLYKLYWYITRILQSNNT